MGWLADSGVPELAATASAPQQPERGQWLQIRTADGGGWMETVLRVGLRKSSSGFPCERCKMPTVKGELVARTDAFYSERDGGWRSLYFCMGCVCRGWRSAKRPANWGRR